MDLAAAAAAEEEERARRSCREYVEALEEERRKIQVFYRELPLSLHLVTHSIEICRQQMSGELFSSGGGRGGGGGGRGGRWSEEECEVAEETTASTINGGGGPLLEDLLLPFKRTSSSSSSWSEEEEEQQETAAAAEKQERSEKKLDWLRSVHLWNHNPDPQHPTDDDDVDPARRPVVVEAKKVSGAFHPDNFQKEKRSPSPPPAVAAAEVVPAPATAANSNNSESTRGGGRIGTGNDGGEEKEGRTHRKARRCWSPELHRRFLHVLQRLGGSHAATPKQIRELMKVEGLTNDEVKSHLQKYRLHTRLPSTTTTNLAQLDNGISSNPQPQQFVFVQGVWVPPPEYAMAASAPTLQPLVMGIVAAAPNGIYDPIASSGADDPNHHHHHHHQQQQQQMIDDEAVTEVP